LEQQDYSYEDREVVANVRYYYRLKQVDTNGTFEYSDVVSARLNKGDTDWKIYPSPIGAQQQLNVDFYSEATTVIFYVMNTNGQRVMLIEQDLTAKGRQLISIDVSALPASTYTLIDANGNSKRFVKIAE
jgi:hypothetical protein